MYFWIFYECVWCHDMLGMKYQDFFLYYNSLSIWNYDVKVDTICLIWCLVLNRHLRCVGVIRFVFQVLQLLLIRFTHETFVALATQLWSINNYRIEDWNSFDLVKLIISICSFIGSEKILHCLWYLVSLTIPELVWDWKHSMQWCRSHWKIFLLTKLIGIMAYCCREIWGDRRINPLERYSNMIYMWVSKM